MNKRKVGKIFIPAQKPKDWIPLLAKGKKHWKEGYSAWALAYCWQEANDFPKSIKEVFSKSDIEVFKNVRLLMAFPEYKVPLQGGLRSSQNDLFILAKSKNELISITVEGKVSEDFGQLVSEWKRLKDDKTNKPERLNFLLAELNLVGKSVERIRYQLLHRAVSALLEAREFNAKNALMLIHSFSSDDEHFDDFMKFLSLFELTAKPNTVTGPKVVKGINLYFAWVRSDEKYCKT